VSTPTLEVRHAMAEGAALAERRAVWSTAMSTTGLVEIAMAVALAAALSLMKVYTMPQGGSVSLEMLPLLYIAVRRGVGVGLAAGAVFGFLQFLLPGFYAVHPAQVALDYVVAFGALGLAGLVPVPVVWVQWRTLVDALRGTSLGGRRFVFGLCLSIAAYALLLAAAVLAGAGARFLAHFFSGWIFFAEYAPAGQPVWLYSLGYQAAYMVPETIITYIVLFYLVPAADAAGIGTRSRRP
jgi:thiamine transporter